MNFSRKLKRKKIKSQKKNFKKAMKDMNKRIDSLGNNCRACGKDFDGESDSLEEWVVYVVDDDPRLICPSCKEQIEKLKQEYIEEEQEDAGINPTGGYEA